MYCSVVGGTVETVIVIRVQPLCLYFDVVCCSHIWQWCTAFRATIFTFQLLQHFVSRLLHISPHNYTAQISNLLPLLLRQQFHVGQTNQWQEKEVIDKLFFFPPNFFSSHAPQERDQENLATNDEPRFLCLSHCYSRTVS